MCSPVLVATGSSPSCRRRRSMRGLSERRRWLQGYGEVRVVMRLSAFKVVMVNVTMCIGIKEVKRSKRLRERGDRIKACANPPGFRHLLPCTIASPKTWFAAAAANCCCHRPEDWPPRPTPELFPRYLRTTTSRWLRPLCEWR